MVIKVITQSPTRPRPWPTRLSVVQVLFFAVARELAGVSELQLELDEQATVQRVMEMVVDRHPSIAPILPGSMISLNEEYTDSQAS